MPGFDGTGPLGQGSMTGRGMGYCAVPVDQPVAPSVPAAPVMVSNYPAAVYPRTPAVYGFPRTGYPRFRWRPRYGFGRGYRGRGRWPRRFWGWRW